MTFLVFLRAVSDAGIYFFFAALVSGLFGARPWAVAAGLATMCLSLTAGYLFRGKRARYAPLLLPAAYIVLVAAGWAERAALIVFFLYGVKLLRAETYEPTWDHEAGLFSRFWKLALAVFVIWFPFAGLSESGMATLERVLLPTVIVTMTALILLTRALRHDRDVYVNTRRQMVDVAIFALLAALAALLGSRPVLGGLWFLLKTVFRYLIYPVLNALLWVAERIVGFLLWLLSYIFPEGELEMPNLSLGQGVSEEQIMPEVSEAARGSALLRVLLILAGAAALAYLTYRLLKLLLLRGPQAADNGERPIERVSLAPENEPRTKKAPRSPVEGVRREYRRFLKLCRLRGVRLRRSDTSLSVNEKAAALSAPPAANTLRALYVAARYGGEADPGAVEVAEKTYREIKRTWRDTEQPGEEDDRRARTMESGKGEL